MQRGRLRGDQPQREFGGVVFDSPSRAGHFDLRGHTFGLATDRAGLPVGKQPGAGRWTIRGKVLRVVKIPIERGRFAQQDFDPTGTAIETDGLGETRGIAALILDQSLATGCAVEPVCRMPA